MGIAPRPYTISLATAHPQTFVIAAAAAIIIIIIIIIIMGP